MFYDVQVRIEDVSLECFLALLEYLYTDHAPIEEGDAVGILVAADRYGQDRLRNLCELYITKGVDVAVANCIAEAHVDVIGLLHTAQVCCPTLLPIFDLKSFKSASHTHLKPLLWVFVFVLHSQISLLFVVLTSNFICG